MHSPIDSIYSVTTVTKDDYDDVEMPRPVGRVLRPPSRFSGLYSVHDPMEELKAFYDVVIDRLVTRVTRIEKKQMRSRRACRVQAGCLVLAVVAIMFLAIVISGVIFYALPQGR